jgi:hypothetical protein
MATYHGTTGSVNFGTDVDGPGASNEAQCFQWSLTLRHDIADITPFSPGNNFKTKLGGMSDAVGSIQFYLEASAATNLEATTAFSDDDKAPTTLTLKTKAAGGGNGKQFEFSALLANLNIDVERQSIVRCSADFQSSDAVTITNL